MVTEWGTATYDRISDPQVHEVAARLPEPVLDYVRLNIVAVRSG